MTTNALGGPFDKSPGDRYAVRKDGEFYGIAVQVTIFGGKVQVSVFSEKPSAVSVEDSQIAMAVERMVLENFRKKEKPPDKPDEPKKLSDGKTIDV